LSNNIILKWFENFFLYSLLAYSHTNKLAFFTNFEIYSKTMWQPWFSKPVFNYDLCIQRLQEVIIFISIIIFKANFGLIR